MRITGHTITPSQGRNEVKINKYTCLEVCKRLDFAGEVNWLFNVAINDISVIYVTAHRCAGGLKKKWDLRSGSQRHRHFVGFFNVPVLASTRDQPFYAVIPHKQEIPLKSPDMRIKDLKNAQHHGKFLKNFHSEYIIVQFAAL